MRSRDGDRGAARALVAFGSHDQVVELGAERQPVRLPRGKVRGQVDAAAAALVAPDGPELLESLRAVDGGLLDARGGQDVVGAAVDFDAAQKVGSR